MIRRSRRSQQIEHFLESLSLETTDLATFEPRLVRLCHALDHLNQLNDDLTRVPPEAADWQPPAGFEEGARALAGWLDTTKDPEAAPGPAIFKAMEDASDRLADERKTSRDKILEDVALQRTPAEMARSGLESFGWADGAVYHAWRLAESLRIASATRPAAIGLIPGSTNEAQGIREGAAQASGRALRAAGLGQARGLARGRDLRRPRCRRKGGTIKAITERVSPRVFRVVALPAPSDREKSQLYMQRYVAHLPTAGEIVIFDRSWYNRAGVEHVMGFCTRTQHRRFLKSAPNSNCSLSMTASC